MGQSLHWERFVSLFIIIIALYGGSTVISVILKEL